MCNFGKIGYNITNYKRRLVIILMQIRPVTDLQNDYNSIEKAILEEKQTMYLTKNGYGSMVMLSLEDYSNLLDRSNAMQTESDHTKKGHIEIISKPKKISDEDDE